MIRSVDRRVPLAFVAVLLALALWTVWQMMLPYLNAVFLALVLGISGYPLYAMLERRLHRPALASLLATGFIVLLIAGPALFMAATVVRQAQSMYAALEASSRSQGGWSLWLNGALERPIAWLASSTGVAIPNLQAALMARLQDASNAAVSGIGGIFGNVTATLFNALVTFMTLFFFFQGADDLRLMALSWTPLPQERVKELLSVAAAAIRANVYGTLAIAGVQGAFLGVGFAIAGLPSPLLWTVIGAICALIPVVGTAILWVPAALMLLVSGAWVRALILTLWCLIVVVGVSDNLLRPLILRGQMTMNTLLILFAIFGGIEYFGVVGIIAGPVVFSVTAALLRTFREMLAEAMQPHDPAEAGG